MTPKCAVCGDMGRVRYTLDRTGRTLRLDDETVTPAIVGACYACRR